MKKVFFSSVSCGITGIKVGEMLLLLYTGIPPCQPVISGGLQLLADHFLPALPTTKPKTKTQSAGRVQRPMAAIVALHCTALHQALLYYSVASSSGGAMIISSPASDRCRAGRGWSDMYTTQLVFCSGPQSTLL